MPVLNLVLNMLVVHYVEETKLSSLDSVGGGILVLVVF
jgi:hypothetical protein